jgi:hypothetical protein
VTYFIAVGKGYGSSESGIAGEPSLPAYLDENICLIAFRVDFLKEESCQRTETRGILSPVSTAALG